MPQAQQRNTRHCPGCDAIIDHLDYRCNVSQWGTESGTADFDGDALDTTDTDINDSENSDWEFFCPSCEEEIGTEDGWDGTMTDEERAEEERQLRLAAAENPRDLDPEPTGDLYEKKRAREDSVIVTCRNCRYRWDSDINADTAREILDNPRRKDQILCPRCETRARKQDVVFA